MTSPAVPDTPRALADDYVERLADLDPSIAQQLGLRPHDDRVPDLSPAGQEAKDALRRDVLGRLDALAADAGPEGWDSSEQRCATLLRDRLGTELEASERGEHLRAVRNIFSPAHQVRMLLSLMPTETAEDWACLGRRMARFPEAYDGYVAALTEGRRRGLVAAPRQVTTLIDQLSEWIGEEPGASWFHDLAAGGPADQQESLQAAATTAADGVAALRQHLVSTYLPATEGTPDAVGRERYLFNVRRAAGADIDPDEVYAWGWQEYRRLATEMQQLAEEILPGATPVAAMRHLDEHGRAVEGVEETRIWLQQMMDRAIAELDGTHFDIAEPIRTVEAMIAPPGSAAAPYYTRPSMNFSRPGRTWLPPMGRTRFPVYDLVSTWYHEGVPGHHLQLAQWVHVAPQLSMFQSSIGSSSGATEGWALYAERLMDELGYLDAEERMGYLDAQMMRAIRVVIDIGLHLELPIPDDSPLAPGETWTPQLATEFFRAHSGRPADFIDSEIVRYLGWPGQPESTDVVGGVRRV